MTEFPLGLVSSVIVEPFARGVVLVVSGEIDIASSSLLTEAIAIELDRGHRRFVVDLSDTALIDCATIRALIEAVRPLQDDAEATVVLAGAGGVVARLLDLLEIDRLFTVAPGREIAVLSIMEGFQPADDGWRHVRRAIPG
jgi:anti-anti-sigma factor